MARPSVENPSSSRSSAVESAVKAFKPLDIFGVKESPVRTRTAEQALALKPLSQEVKSRARILPVPYPPEKRGSKFAPDEPMILAKYSASLGDLKQPEFEALWDFVVNNDRASGGDKFVTDDRKEACAKILQIIKTDNRLREAYEAFHSGKTNASAEFIFSMRESVSIATELNHVKDVKQAIKDVVLPKISDAQERDRVRTVIENV